MNITLPLEADYSVEKIKNTKLKMNKNNIRNSSIILWNFSKIIHCKNWKIFQHKNFRTQKIIPEIKKDEDYRILHILEINRLKKI